MASARSAAAVGGAGAAAGECAHRTAGSGAQRCARLGLVALPELSTIDLRAALEQRGVRVATPSSAVAALPEAERRKSVVVVQDAFTTHYDTAVVLDFFELLQRLGFRPWLAPFLPNGKPQHVLGLLDAFERTARRNADMLKELADTGVRAGGRRSVDDARLSRRVRQGAGQGTRVRRSRCRRNGWRERLDELPATGGRRQPDLVAAAALHRADQCTGRHVRLGQGWPPPRRRPADRRRADAAAWPACTGTSARTGRHRKRSTGSAGDRSSLTLATRAGRSPRAIHADARRGWSMALQLMHPLQLLLRAVKAGPAAHSMHADAASVARARASRGVLRASGLGTECVTR